MIDQLLRAIKLADDGEWDAAHRIVQQLDNIDAAWLHANLHREEGDPVNANYWYVRAGRPCPDVSVAAERQAIRAAFQSETT